MKETMMWKKLRDCFNDLVPYGVIERIDSARIPDIHYRTATHEGWIELKQLKQRRNHWVVPFRPGQFAWLSKYRILNGVSILVATMRDETIGDDWYCFKGREIQERYYNTELYGYKTKPLAIIQLIVGCRPITV